MTDKWLAPDTCGVKLAEFERMTQDMTRAAPALAALADQLWQALNGAGVNTAPAMEIKRIAAWAQTAATELRRRNALAHDLDRQAIGMKVCRPDGTYLTLPDRYTDQAAYAEGRRYADLARRAAAGDREALSSLRRLEASDVTPAMAKALVTELGAQGMYELTGKLADQVRAHRADTSLSRDTWAVLGVLGKSLALTTDPAKQTGYVGDKFLGDLVRAGEGHFPPRAQLPAGITGFQALSTLLAAAGETRFSPRFIQTVGTGMLAHDREIRKTFGDAPLPNLTSRFTPGANSSSAPGAGPDFLIPLLNAATNSGKAGAQALLQGLSTGGPHPSNIPPSAQMNNLRYLLSDRRNLWGQGPNADHGAALGNTLKVAASGQDDKSQALAFNAGKILADDAKKLFTVNGEKIEIKDKDRVDALSGLREPVAQLFGAHITKMNDIYRAFGLGAKSGSTPMTDADLDYLLLELTRGAEAYDTLLKAQMAHARVAIDGAVREGKAGLENVIIGEGWMFGHLLESRYQAVQGERGRLADDKKRIEGYVSTFVGFAGGKAVEAGSQRVPVVGEGFNLVVGKAQSELTNWLVGRMADRPDSTILAPKSGTESVEELASQMIIASMLAHDQLPKSDLKGQPFVTPGPRPEILPIESMTGDQLEDFARWANNSIQLGSLRETVKSSIEQGGRETAGHFGDGPDGKSVRPAPR